MAIGFSHRIGLLQAAATSASGKWQAFGVATNTASTSGQRQSFSAESKAKGISYCRADACAFARSRRERAVTRQFLARAKPGINRFHRVESETNDSEVDH